MTTSAWVSIGVAVLLIVAGAIQQIYWYLKKRGDIRIDTLVTRIDLLEKEVLSGMHAKLSLFVSHDHLTTRLEEFRAQLLGVSEEAERREERIVGVIENQTGMIAAQVRDLREDVRNQTKRIDNLNFRSGGTGER